MEATSSGEIDAVLSAWRTRILNGFLLIAAIACVPILVLTLLSSLRQRGQWLAFALFALLLLLLAVLAFWRSLDSRIRAWGILSIGYVAGIMALARGGLAGSGRDFLLVLPITALILLGGRAGVFLSILSGLILAVFAVLAERGLLLRWLILLENPLRLSDWATEAGTSLTLLAVVMVLLVLFHRFQVKTIEDQRRTARELEQAQALLQEQNASLEQRIHERTNELAQATREAQREKLYSEALIQNSPVAIVSTDAEANVITWNPAAERLFGFTTADASGRNLDELVANDPAIQPIKAEAVVDSRKESGQALIHAITQRTRRDGMLVDVEVWAVPVSVEGEEIRVLALYHDLTEIKQAEQALQESQRQLADIINFMPDAVLVIDQERKIIAWNRAIEEMTGTKAEEMLGKGNYEHALPFYGERRPILIDLVTMPQKELEQKYAHIRREGPVLIGETYVPQLKEGGAYLLGTASALRDSQGEVVGAIEVIRDFTERKQMEEALQQAKETAEAATQAKSSFLAMMSHEIRTPMNAIIGMTGLLLDTHLTADQREFAETVRSSGDALLTIINDILDFSKMEAGKMDLEQQPFDLRECVESALDLMKLKASEKGLELACEIAGDLPPAIIGDVTRLRQVLVNLLSNAVKFTEQGEVVVSVRREDVTREGVHHVSRLTEHELHFTVRDTGIGIPPDRLNRLFQAFSQVDSSTTRKYGGTGLGLAVSKRLSEMMGGTMWVESEGVPGKGSAFHFTIRAPEATEAQVRTPPHREAPELAGRSVLIVDDNATNRRILTLQAQGWGMQVRATGSPDEALGWVRQGERFDMAVLDLHMPEMDGVELAEALHDVETATPLILLSSLGGYGTEIPAGLFAACLTKPIRASALFDALMGIFARSVQEAPVPAAVPARPDVEMAQRQPLRILIAEDYVVNQKLALRLLAQMGYRADVAGNGLEAIQALERQPYDVILMDVQMPEMDGLEATRQICARWPSGARPRIIAMTANAMQGDREICLAAGMDDYVSKPIRVDELVQALARCRPLAPDRAPA